MPGLAEMHSRYQTLFEDERRRQKSQYVEERNTVSLKWLESQLTEILSEKQNGRLDALLLQMKGPRAIVIVPGIIGRLGLTSDQTEKIQNIVGQFNEELSPFSHRYGHNMLQVSRSSQTIEESEKEQEAIVVVITEILKARDEAILSELTKAQCDQWHVMQGRLLPVSWPEGFYVPFHNDKKASNKSLQATRDGGSSSASRFTLVGPACLSSGR
jgi:hypothetical protein